MIIFLAGLQAIPVELCEAASLDGAGGWPTLTGDPFTIFLLRQYMLGIPVKMGEAARVDGANEFQIYLRVTIPLVRPALAVAAVFAFVYSYNNFFGPLIYLTNPTNYTLSLGVYQFIQIHGTPDIAEIVAHTALVVAPTSSSARSPSAGWCRGSV
ncbi:MAG TPA: ABC transporter permease subunit [Candidatus Dormibacteraeota bacterium]|nr:ABC transporter permease subunit [Candidatus Dormibacteraeota bacterium]